MGSISSKNVGRSENSRVEKHQKMKKTINCGRNLINKANNCCTNNISEYHV